MQGKTMPKTRTIIQVINNYQGKSVSLKPYKPFIEKIIYGEKFHIRELDVIVVDEEYLRKLHHQYLNDDSYTDVMTFNLSESGEIEAEIYISYDRAKFHARQYQVPVTDEIARLICHGLLHLRGHDDRTPAQKQKMHQMENELLRKYWIKSRA